MAYDRNDNRGDRPRSARRSAPRRGPAAASRTADFSSARATRSPHGSATKRLNAVAARTSASRGATCAGAGTSDRASPRATASNASRTASLAKRRTIGSSPRAAMPAVASARAISSASPAAAGATASRAAATNSARAADASSIRTITTGAGARSTTSTATMRNTAARTRPGSRDDFSGWRQRRMAKRQMLGQIREHMEVVGSDDTHVGIVDTHRRRSHHPHQVRSGSRAASTIR